MRVGLVAERPLPVFCKQRPLYLADIILRQHSSFVNKVWYTRLLTQPSYKLLPVYKILTFSTRRGVTELFTIVNLLLLYIYIQTHTAESTGRPLLWRTARANPVWRMLYLKTIVLYVQVTLLIAVAAFCRAQAGLYNQKCHTGSNADVALPRLRIRYKFRARVFAVFCPFLKKTRFVRA